MKKLFFYLIFVSLVSFSCSDSLDLKVITFNIRYDNPRDGDNAWPYRKDLATSFILEEEPDIFGLQEALWHQFAFMDSVLSDNYESVGVGRSDGKRGGEMTPIFFKEDRFRLLDSETFWLSESPEIPGSKGWGAVLPRIVTWAKLNDKRSGQDFFYFNTHFSHISDSARVMSSKILSSMVREISGDSFFIITGDFNMTPKSIAYSELSSSAKDELIADTYKLSTTLPSGPRHTFNGFKDVVTGSRIDYIFARNGVIVETHSTINIKKKELFISDHWPVSCTLTWSF